MGPESNPPLPTGSTHLATKLAFAMSEDCEHKGNYEALDPEHILATIDRLKLRIKERFPERGIVQICGRLRLIASRSRATAEWTMQPILWVRFLTGALVLLIICGLVATLMGLNPTDKPLTIVEFVPALEAGINDVVLIGAGIFFLVTLEIRMKRKRALTAVHELRSLIHIIDMHQLTKDPERLQVGHHLTDSSPGPDLTRFQLNRYLDYCSEMLSLCAKIAALYAQNFADAVVLSAVGEVENLALGLSNNVWQKISILQSLPQEEDRPIPKAADTPAQEPQPEQDSA
jgi:hypothetical protein